MILTEQSTLFLIGLFMATAAYLLKNFVFEPLLEYRKVKGRVHNRIKFHEFVITNGDFPRSTILPIQEEMRQLSCDFEESYYAIPFAPYFPTFYRIVTFDQMNTITSNLILLYNTTGHNKYIDWNINAVEQLKSTLDISSSRTVKYYHLRNRKV